MNDKAKMSILNFSFKRNAALFLIISIIISIIFSKIISGEIKMKIFLEKIGFEKMYGKTWSVPLITFQIFYYFSELFLVSIIFFVFQKIGEEITSLTFLPWGGIFIGIYWGLAHFLTGHAKAAFPLFIFSILIGFITLLGNKNFFILYLSLIFLYIL